jgi:UDP-N-acetylglucosamine 2-epimerase
LESRHGVRFGQQIPHNPQWGPATSSGQDEHRSRNIDVSEHQPRKSKERQEAIDAGFAELVGTDRKKVVKRVWDWIEHDWSVPNRKSPFGDGTAAEKTVEILQKDGYC